jgi:hypothetical protein
MSATSKKFPQVVASLVATLGAFALGGALGWTSPSLPKIDSSQCGDSCDINNVDADKASWIGGILSLGAVAAGPITGHKDKNLL